MSNIKKVLGDARPVIGMVHPGALPRNPFHDAAWGLAGLSGCMVGSALKYDGYARNAICPDRAQDFTAGTRAARGGK